MQSLSGSSLGSRHLISPFSSHLSKSHSEWKTRAHYLIPNLIMVRITRMDFGHKYYTCMLMLRNTGQTHCKEECYTAQYQFCCWRRNLDRNLLLLGVLWPLDISLSLLLHNSSNTLQTGIPTYSSLYVIYVCGDDLTVKCVCTNCVSHIYCTLKTSQ